jgi:hypothetical protein
VLLVAAALLLQSCQHVLHVDPGFRPDGLATLRVNPPPTYEGDAASWRVIIFGRATAMWPIRIIEPDAAPKQFDRIAR